MKTSASGGIVRQYHHDLQHPGIKRPKSKSPIRSHSGFDSENSSESFQTRLPAEALLNSDSAQVTSKTSAVSVNFVNVALPNILRSMLSNCDLRDPGIVGLYASARAFHESDEVRQRVVASQCFRAFDKPGITGSGCSILLGKLLAKITALPSELQFEAYRALVANKNEINRNSYWAVHYVIVNINKQTNQASYNDYLELRMNSALRVDTQRAFAEFLRCKPTVEDLAGKVGAITIDKARLLKNLVAALPNFNPEQKFQLINDIHSVSGMLDQEDRGKLLPQILDISNAVDNHELQNNESLHLIAVNSLPAFIIESNGQNAAKLLLPELQRLFAFTLKLDSRCRQSASEEIVRRFTFIKDKTVLRQAFSKFIDHVAIQQATEHFERHEERLLNIFGHLSRCELSEDLSLNYKIARTALSIINLSHKDFFLQVAERLEHVDATGKSTGKTVAEVILETKPLILRQDFINAIAPFLRSEFYQYR